MKTPHVDGVEATATPAAARPTSAGWYVDARPVLTKRMREIWEQLDFTRAWVDPGPSPAGNPGPYLKVPRIENGEEYVHRVYAVGPGTAHVLRSFIRDAAAPMVEARRVKPL